MASRTFHFTTVANTNPVPIANLGTNAAITGYVMSNVAATAIFAKFYWGNANSFSSAKDVPTVGTDIPALTVPLAAGTATAPGVAALTWTSDAAPRGNGMLFVAFTGAQADSDTTAPAAGALVSVTYW